MKLTDLFTDGLIVAVHVSEWRARLGIEPSDIRVDWSADVERAMYLGAHRLANAEAFEAIHKAANEAVRIVERASLPFPLIPASRYMPLCKLEGVAEELARCKAEFLAAVEAFCEPVEFAAMKERQLSEVIRPALESVLVRDGFVDAVAVQEALSRIRGGYPAVEDVRGRFSLSWQVFSLQSASSATVAALSGEADQVRGVLGDMLGELRAEVRDKLEAVVALVARGGKFTQRTINSALAVLDRCDEFNLWGDEVYKQEMEAVEKLVEELTVEMARRDAEGADSLAMAGRVIMDKDQEIVSLEAQLARMRERIAKVPHLAFEFLRPVEGNVRQYARVIEYNDKFHASIECAELGGQCAFVEGGK